MQSLEIYRLSYSLQEMRKKGEQLGADSQLTKPEIGKLVEAIDKLIDKA